jgi:serine/threonine protein kinase/tetratricopeptide (TPR) repeat protein
MNAPSQVVGRTLGHYRIIEAIGAGGMGVVYRGRDERLDRDVALKLLPSDRFSDAEARRRFRNEALMLSQLNHPNIASIYDFDSQDGLDFLVMELIAGVTLAKKLEKGPFSESESLYISRQILAALGEAHRIGIVHRDLKPSNVVVSSNHHVKILDFGLSTNRKNPTSVSTESLEELGHDAGTLPYMAPEILQGKPCDARADIWSAGVVMYEMTAGHRPFGGKTSYEVSSAILGSDPANIPEPVSQGFRAVVMRCLVKEPERRYQNVGEVEAALACVNTSGTRPRSLTRRGALIILALLALTVFSVVMANKYFSASRYLPAEKQLAILPIPASSDSPELTAFGDGLNETLATRLNSLTRSNNLQVIPTSEIRARGIKTLQDANQEFGVNLGLEIAIRRSGDMVRVNYSLVDAKTHRQLRADTITAPASDPFALEDRVSNSIIDALELELAPQERRAGEDHGTLSARAFDYYLQGRGELQEFEKPENVDRAITAFNKAIEADPHYALALAGLGEAYWQKYDQSHDVSYIERATNACKSAVELENSAAEGHICLGTVFQSTGQYSLASTAFAKARELDPTSDQAVVGAASVYQALGMPDKAEETYRRAIEMRPQYRRNYSLLGAFYVSQGQYDKAANMFRKVIAISPDSFRGYSNLGGVETYQGRYADAISTLEKSIAIRKTGDALSNLGTAYFHLRKFDESASAFQEAITFDERNYPLWGNLADAYYYGGHRSEAAAAYSKAASLADQQLSVNAQDGAVLAALAGYYSMLNDKDASFLYIGRALRSAPRDPEVLFDTAQIYNQFGNEKETMIWLQKALDAGFPVVQVQDSPSLDNLRSAKEFRNLLNSHEHTGTSARN